MRQNAQAAAVNQRIGGVARMVVDGTVDGGDTHLVTVIFNALNHAVGDARRMQHIGGQVGVVQVGRAEAEYIGIGDGAGADAQNVAHYAAHAGISPAKRVERRGVVVGFGLKRQVVSVVEFDDAGIVHKGRVNPGFVDFSVAARM
jgi:hypothetical protein